MFQKHIFLLNFEKVEVDCYMFCSVQYRIRFKDGENFMSKRINEN